MNWTRFLKADSDEELEELAKSDPNIREAKPALDHLRADPAARALAEERHRALHFYQEDVGLAREEEEVTGLHTAIETLCEVFGINLDETRRHELEQGNAATLNALLDHLRTHRRRPDS